MFGTAEFVILDGQPGPRYDSILGANLTFDADGRLEYLAVKQKTLYRVVHPAPFREGHEPTNAGWPPQRVNWGNQGGHSGFPRSQNCARQAAGQ